MMKFCDINIICNCFNSFFSVKDCFSAFFYIFIIMSVGLWRFNIFQLISVFKRKFYLFLFNKFIKCNNKFQTTKSDIFSRKLFVIILHLDIKKQTYFCEKIRIRRFKIRRWISRPCYYTL